MEKAMTHLLIRLLGPFEATLDGEPATGFHSDKVRALLAYLCVEERGAHRREKLAGLLWPDLPERSARANLRRALANLRKVLGDRPPSGGRPATSGFLVITRQTIRFYADSDTWVDALAFLDTLETRQPPLAKLEEAVALYRGELMEGFSLPDSASFEEWLLLQRERFERLALEALHRLAEVYTVQGRYERALTYAWRQVELDPLRENAYRQLMGLLALSGRRSEALAQYARCRSLLAEELDVPPSEDTVRLYEQIRDEVRAESLPAPRGRARPTHNLPVAPGPFVGREGEVAEIQGCLQDPACRLLTLVGGGGMGKTRLVLEAVRDWISRRQAHELQGATLVSLAPVQTSEAIAPAIAKAAGFPLSAGRQPEEQVLEALRQKRWLLILDSFEHLLEGAGFVARILRTAPHVQVLVTSRARLNLQGEYCYPVAGLEFPEPIAHDAQKTRTFAAVELFLQAVHRVRPGFQPTDTDLAEIARVCRLVEGMPLGILLAAAWMGVLGPAEIAAEIDEGLDLLEADWADVPERQRSIRAVFDRSWNLLTEREREVFQGLSVFSGGFSRAAAQHVSGASLHELRSLTEKSLLQATLSGRYEVHELLRQYAAEKLHSSPDAAIGAHDRHAAYYMAALRDWEADLTGARHQEALIEMEAELGNVSAAWAWAVEQGQVERLGPAMWGLVQFYWHSGRYREGAATLRAAATAAEAAARDVDDKAACLRVWMQALAWQSSFQRAIGQRETAQQLQQQCQVLLEDPALAGSDTRLERAIVSWCMGATICMADYGQGRQRFEESYSLFRALDHRWGMAWALTAWGSMSMFLGEYRDARRRFEEALAIYRALDYQSGLAGCLSHLAQIAWMQGQFEDTEALAREGVVTARRAGSVTELAYALLCLGEALEMVGKFLEAHSVFLQCLALYSELGHRDYITEVHTSLGRVELHLGRYEETGDHLQTSLALAREHGPPYCIALNLSLLGSRHLAAGAHPRAHRFLQESIAAFREVGGTPDDLGSALAALALAAHGQGDIAGARQHLCQTLELAQESGVVSPLLWVLPAIALVLADEREVERAVELYALASRYPFVAESRWFADVVGNQIAAAADTLPADQVAILQARGRTRDLGATVAELLAELRQ